MVPYLQISVLALKVLVQKVLLFATLVVFMHGNLHGVSESNIVSIKLFAESTCKGYVVFFLMIYTLTEQASVGTYYSGSTNNFS